MLTPAGDGRTLEILLKGDLAGMLAAAGSPRKQDTEEFGRQIAMVAGACNRRYLARWWIAA
ncbi:MAG TPA: hypothetical protein VGJ78_09180 [Vicinamibacterales bacterium]